MAYATLVGAAITAMAWGTDRWLRHFRRPTRHVWMVAMQAMVAVPLLVAIRPRTVREVPAVAAAPIAPTIANEGAGSAAASPFDVAVLVWAVGSAAVLLAIVGGMSALVVARRGGVVASWYGTLVLETDDVGPGAAPWGNPAILVPRALRTLPEPSARLLLAHEREHVAAGDARWLLAATGFLVLMPWNLPLWYCLRRLRTAIECDCDARVLRHGIPLGDYASLLLDLAAPRGRPLPALLPLASSTTQLHTRIDAMTATPVLTPARRLATLLLVVVAGVAACETRMPAPVAPLADYIVTDGKAAPVAITEENRDSVRASLVEGVQLSLLQADTSTAPVLVVRDANGVAVYSGRMNGARDSILAGVAPEVIQSVEVIKGRATLPEGARGGMIVVRLKPGAAWTVTAQRPQATIVEQPIAATGDQVRVRIRPDAGVQVVERPMAAQVDSGALVLELSKAETSVEAELKPRVRIRALSRDRSPAVEGPLREGADSATTRSITGRVEPMVSILDAEGREVWSGREMGREVGGVMHFGDYRVLTADIARVEVFKGRQAPEGGLIQVHLKAGAKVTKP
jgi:beta-lactamase regulating signal transducer with metallopeptidase domain